VGLLSFNVCHPSNFFVLLVNLVTRPRIEAEAKMAVKAIVAGYFAKEPKSRQNSASIRLRR
ncbi:MAG: hypothetical protein KKB37_12010, partial [Alphaproteobacteria bacterium]|nr:hypothetical protein [Alphaproteobacteria bacterium]